MKWNIKRRSGAFTLLELLVVVSIIVLLLALLVPGLAGAKSAAKTTVCGANVRNLCQVMNVYAAEWDGSILGNPNTTARFLYDTNFAANGIYSNVNCPSVVQTFDWMGPTMQTMGVYYDDGKASLADRAKRFTAEMNFKMFICPSSNLTGLFFDNGGMTLPGAMPVPSYCTALLFQLNGYQAGVDYYTYEALPNVALPNGYRPKIQLVGATASKIYIADGARYSDTMTKPDLNLHVVAEDESNTYSDPGACFQNGTDSHIQTHCWDRSLAPGTGNTNVNGGSVDARIYAYRHGETSQKGASGAYRMQAGFFDGHAEIMTDKDSANPAYWMPSGTMLKQGSSDGALQTDTVARYLPSGNLQVP